MNEGCERERYNESILSKHFPKRNSAWPESTTVILIHAPEDLQLTRRCHGFLDTATTSPWTWRLFRPTEDSVGLHALNLG